MGFPFHRLRDAARRRADIAGWTAGGHLRLASRRDLDRHLPAWPLTADWRAFLDVAALWLAGGLLGAGLILLVAANWDVLDVLGRIGGMELAVLACAAVAHWRRHRPREQDAALLAGALASGALLALVGQTYQLGADTAELFGAWALAILPWALAGRSPITWLLACFAASLAVFNATGAGGINVGVYLPMPDWIDPWLATGFAQLLMLVGWEAARARRRGPAGSLGPRCLAGAAIALLSAHAITRAFHGMDGFDVGFGWVPWLAAKLALGGWYFRRRPDLVILAMLAIATVAVTASFATRVLVVMTDDFAATALGAAVVVIAEAAWFTQVLRRLAAKWDLVRAARPQTQEAR